MAAPTDWTSSTGSQFFMSLATPASLDAAGYGAVGMTYTEVGHIDSIGEYGPEAAENSRTPLKTGVKEKRKGVTDYGAIPLNMAMVQGDAGQELLIEASDPAYRNPVTCYVKFPDGTKEYFRALIMSYKRNPGGAEANLMATVNVSITSPLVTVYPT